MKKSTRILCTASLATAVLVALSAYASGTSTGHVAPGTKVLLAKPAPQASFNRFIVRYQDGSTMQRSASALLGSVNAAAMRAGVAGLKPAANGTRTVLNIEYVRKLAIGADLIRTSRGLNQTEADALLAQLRADPAVKYAQPDYIKHRLDFIPNDTRFSDLQWDFANSTVGIGAPTAWGTGTTNGTGVVVAVLDTGYVDHADLNANIVPGYDFIIDTTVSGDGDGRDADAHDTGDWEGSGSSSWHGTHVAGTVAAVTNNAKGIAGVAFGAKVEPVRVLGHGGGYTSDIADGIIWASGGSVAGVPANTNPAEVINMSLGGYGMCSDDPVTQAAIDGAISRGTTVVVAAGNDNGDAAQHSPASCKSVIAVGATGFDGARSFYSNFGPTVTLSAPGGNGSSGNTGWIWSTGNSGTTTPVASPAGDVLMGYIGTSQATPHVAGVVALMQSAAVAAGRPVLTPAQVKTVLRNTVKPFTVAPPLNKSQGPGILDAAAAVYAATQPIPVDLGTPLDNRVALGGQTGASGDSLLFQITVPAGKRSLNLRSYGGTGDVSLYVSRGVVPTTAVYNRKATKPGNSEAVVITNPAAGTYYLRLVGEQPFTNVSVLGIYQ